MALFLISFIDLEKIIIGLCLRWGRIAISLHHQSSRLLWLFHEICLFDIPDWIWPGVKYFSFVSLVAWEIHISHIAYHFLPFIACWCILAQKGRCWNSRLVLSSLKSLRTFKFTCSRSLAQLWMTHCEHLARQLALVAKRWTMVALRTLLLCR